MSFKVPTSQWGEVEVRYNRTADGREFLSVPACKQSPEEWSERKIGPPPILLPIDVTTTTEWNGYMRKALLADVAEAKAAEDEKFNYRPAKNKVGIDPKTAKIAGAKRKGKPVSVPAASIADDEIPPAPPPHDPGTAAFVDPSTLRNGPRPIQPRSSK